MFETRESVLPQDRTLSDRRAFMARLAGLGVASAAFPAVLLALAEEKGALTEEVVLQAEKVAGLAFTDAQRKQLLKGLNDLSKDFEKLRKVPLPNGVPPALRFSPLLPGQKVPPGESSLRLPEAPSVDVGADLEALSFLPVTQLAALLKSRRVTSLQLTEMYLARLKRYDPVLHFVVTLTEERALAQARKADEEIAAGKYRGRLHGVPWGAKDLLAVKGYRTTWGAATHKDQVIDEDAEVVKRLDAAGAVLVAKLTLGALAMGDVWFGGKTRNPWNPEDGSSGSSAGSASAVAAGCVGFAIGTETLGSIVSPCTRCGCTGLRPTFGRVPRTGAMALSWSMDKIGPIARSVEDCALIMAAIQGPDGKDDTVIEAPFSFDATKAVSGMRVGYVKSAFDRTEEEDPDAEEKEKDKEWPGFDRAALEVLKGLGVTLVPMELPDLPANAMALLLTCEAAAAFDDLTRSGRDALLTAQGDDDWPNLFRQAQLIPAVQYIQANRARTVLMRSMEDMLDRAGVEAYVCPSFGGDNLTVTNLTGHPQVVVPDGFRQADGTPTSICFTSRLFEEGKALALANAYQRATGFHLKNPGLMG
jgi:Asp-tRNA(Asn)/Glu-tRNA(Gln) amidotransferase A subunit family amidase